MTFILGCASQDREITDVTPYFRHPQPITDAHVSYDHGIPMYVTHTN